MKEEDNWQGVLKSTTLSLGVCTTPETVEDAVRRILDDFPHMPQAVRAELDTLRTERLYRLEKEEA